MMVIVNSVDNELYLEDAVDNVLYLEYANDGCS